MPDIRAEQFITQPEALDSFGRLRICAPTTTFDSHLQYNTQPIVFERKTTAGGTITHEPNGSSVLLTVNNTSGASAILQTREYNRHQLAKTQLIRVAGTLFDSALGIASRFGYFDDDNGIFVESKNGIISIVFRSSTTGSVVDDIVSQGGFNIDPLSGSSRSGRTIDPNKSQLMEIDFSSMGSIRVGFWLDGFLFFAHNFGVTNLFAGSPMSTVSLPIRYEVTNTTGVNSGQLRMLYGSVISEGGTSLDSTYTISASNGRSTIAVTTRTPVLSIRPRELFNSITNRASITPNMWSLFTEDEPVLVELVWGGTLTGASFSNVNDDHSVTESDVVATMISGGIIIDTAYVVPNAKAGVKVTGEGEGEIKFPYPMTLDIDGNHPVVGGETPFTDVFSIVATSMEPLLATTNISAALRWGEIY